jgi:hypothetical protein
VLNCDVMTGSKPGGTGSKGKGSGKAGTNENESSSTPFDPKAVPPASLAVTSKVNAPDDVMGGEAEDDGKEDGQVGGDDLSDARATDSPLPRVSPETAKLASLLAEDRAALGRLGGRDQNAAGAGSQRAFSPENAFDALEITAVSGVGLGADESDLLEREKAPSGWVDSGPISESGSISESGPISQSEFDRLEITAVADSGRQALAPHKVESTETKGPHGTRPTRVTPGAQRIAALLAQTRAKSGRHETLASRMATDASPTATSIVGSPPSPGPATARDRTTSNPGATLLGVSAPDLSQFRSAGQTGRTTEAAQSGKVGQGQGRGAGFSLLDDTERNTSAPAFADSAAVSGGFEISTGPTKRRPRGAIGIVVATALVVLAVGVVFPRYRKANQRKALTSSAVSTPLPPAPSPTIQPLPQVPSPPATGAPTVGSPPAQDTPVGSAVGVAPPSSSAPSEQPQAPIPSGSVAEPRTGGAPVDEPSAGGSRAETQGDEKGASSSTESSPGEPKRKLRRGKHRTKAAKSGSPRAVASPPGATAPTTDRAKTKPSAPARDDPDATLPLTGR